MVRFEGEAGKAMERYIKTSTVAKIFKKHPDTILQWVEARVFKGVLRIRGQYLFSEEEVEMLAKKWEVEGN